jgi:hypothetical protein
MIWKKEPFMTMLLLGLMLLYDQLWKFSERRGFRLAGKPRGRRAEGIVAMRVPLVALLAYMLPFVIRTNSDEFSTFYWAAGCTTAIISSITFFILARPGRRAVAA